MRVFIIVLVLILSGCAITYETPKCELMLRGEECLLDYRCCNPSQVYYHQTRKHWNWWYWNKPYYNKTIIINKPNNKPNKPNNKPNITRKHRK